MKLTQVQGDKNPYNNLDGTKCSNFGVFLWQYATFELLYSVLRAYSSGISENLKRGIDHLLVPDDVFVIGKSICINMAQFKIIRFDKTVMVPQDLE